MNIYIYICTHVYAVAPAGHTLESHTDLQRYKQDLANGYKWLGHAHAVI